MTKSIDISKVQIQGETYFKISNHDAMRPFFMSIVSDSDHWMFISSNGGLSAGRKNAEYSLFPYYTDDKITESAEITGSKTLLQVQQGEGFQLWEPFSERQEGRFNITRNLYKNVYGDKVLFEEINHDLNLSFRYQWSSSDQFGFVKQSSLTNLSDAPADITLLDGIQNIIPYGVSSDIQVKSSNLVDAYKRSELVKEIGLGIFALSAIIVDKAEPSEALKANAVWSIGLEDASYLLSSLQLKRFRKGLPLEEEVDIKGEKGAYFVHTDVPLAPQTTKQWSILADVNKNHAAIAKLADRIKKEADLQTKIQQDVAEGTKKLIGLTAAADGQQHTADELRDSRHFSNTLFNIMRGGIFDDNYQIEKWDFTDYLAKANSHSFKQAEDVLAKLPETFSLLDLKELANNSADADFKRLCLEYMPLKFSRRHGDPSRPWNRFSINTRNEIDGSKILDYEGNWRDIFQNWEALAHSYPNFIESMIHKFLNATTFDGYNPYRVTKGGFDWETIEPDDPWSYIGYWGDHQIIYLLKFLEFSENFFPGLLASYFNQDLFVYANVPYKIKSFEDTLKNPKDTIDFDLPLDEEIRARREELGADGALLRNQLGNIHRVNFVEKILATLLAKLSNFIPEGGIWLNTQRPEWNDANNALVGNGVSMVTLYYIRRFLKFFKDLFESSAQSEVAISKELITFLEGIKSTLENNKSLLAGSINDQDRRKILNGVGQAGSTYRNTVYAQDFSGEKQSLAISELSQLIEVCLAYMDHSIRANERADHLYHAYNIMTLKEDGGVSISYLSEMLEGQVAALSSGYLSASEALSLLDALKASKLFRPDQYSYILYPNKELPLFTQKNNIPKTAIQSSSLLQQLLADGNLTIIEQDIAGDFHFNGNFKNAGDLDQALESLSQGQYSTLIKSDRKQVLQIFEEVFNHKAFTGRSGTFFGYEGLGSIYWHMVSKLLLAVQECCLQAIKEGESEETIGRLLEHFYEINEGIGVHKSPSLYGAFPTDPYSHTPAGKGAQQPGMTGQVKEDILSRFGELGVFVVEGQVRFDPCLLRKEEFLSAPQNIEFIDVQGKPQDLSLPAGALCFSYAQVPIVYQIAEEIGLEVHLSSGEKINTTDLSLAPERSQQLFNRTGEINKILVRIKANQLR